MDKLLDKIELKYGDFGVGVFMGCVIVSGFILALIWLATVAAYGWPILLPFIIAGYMLYKVNQGEPK